MAKIHGLVYLFVGILVVVVSSMVHYKNLLFFLFIGIIFIIIGLGKISLKFLGKKEKQEHTRTVGQSQSVHKYCSRCGTIARHFDQFCSRCGHKIFHYK